MKLLCLEHVLHKKKSIRKKSISKLKILSYTKTEEKQNGTLMFHYLFNKHISNNALSELNYSSAFQDSTVTVVLYYTNA